MGTDECIWEWRTMLSCWIFVEGVHVKHVSTCSDGDLQWRTWWWSCVYSILCSRCVYIQYIDVYQSIGMYVRAGAVFQVQWRAFACVVLVVYVYMCGKPIVSTQCLVLTNGQDVWAKLEAHVCFRVAERMWYASMYVIASRMHVHWDNLEPVTTSLKAIVRPQWLVIVQTR